jgi:putative heme transporter
VAVLLPRMPGFPQARELIAELDTGELALLLAVAVLNVTTWTLLTVTALPGLRLHRGAMVSLASATIANTLPWGDALSLGVMWTMYTSWGYTTAQIGLAVLAGGGANLAAKLLLPLVALALLGTAAGTVGELLALAAYGLGAILLGALLVAALLAPGVARWLGRALGWTVSGLRRGLRRPPVEGWEERALAVRTDALALLRRRGPLLLVAGLCNWLTTYLVLLTALRLVGVGAGEVSAAEALAAFAFAHLVTTLPLPAGGLGVVDLGLQAGLVAAGAAAGPALAAVLLFRACTYLLPVPLGAVVWVAWRVSAAARR